MEEDDPRIVHKLALAIGGVIQDGSFYHDSSEVYEAGKTNTGSLGRAIQCILTNGSTANFLEHSPHLALSRVKVPGRITG